MKGFKPLSYFYSRRIIKVGKKKKMILKFQTPIVFLQSENLGKHPLVQEFTNVSNPYRISTVGEFVFATPQLKTEVGTSFKPLSYFYSRRIILTIVNSWINELKVSNPYRISTVGESV